MNARVMIVLAGLLGASGVALGAYHAHGLARWLERQVPSASDPAQPAGASSEVLQRRMANAETAVKYQLFHAVALLGLAALQSTHPRRALSAAAGIMMVGLAGFSGGLYQIVFTGRPWHWAIVPAGGVLLIIAWLAIAASGLTLATKK